MTLKALNYFAFETMPSTSRLVMGEKQIPVCLQAIVIWALLFVAKSFPSLNHSLPLVTFLNLSFVNQAIKSFSTFNSVFNPLNVRDYKKPKAIFYFYLTVAFENLSLC